MSTEQRAFYCTQHMGPFCESIKADYRFTTEDVHAKFRKPCAVEGCEDNKARRVRYTRNDEDLSDGSAVERDVLEQSPDTVVPSQSGEGDAIEASGLESGLGTADGLPPNVEMPNVELPPLKGDEPFVLGVSNAD